MRTPDYVLFVKEEGGGRYDPETGGRTEGVRTEWSFPCMVIPMSLAKQFTDYGTRNRRIITLELNARMDQDFDYALVTSRQNNMDAEKYQKIEEIAPHTKSTIRLERMG